jgi:hypothetical protein
MYSLINLTVGMYSGYCTRDGTATSCRILSCRSNDVMSRLTCSDGIFTLPHSIRLHLANRLHQCSAASLHQRTCEYSFVKTSQLFERKRYKNVSNWQIMPMDTDFTHAHTCASGLPLIGLIRKVQTCYLRGKKVVRHRNGLMRGPCEL